MSEKDIMIGEGVKFERFVGSPAIWWVHWTVSTMPSVLRNRPCQAFGLPLAWSASEPQFENKTGTGDFPSPVFYRKNMRRNTMIRICGVVRESIVDGPGLRFVLFTQGCPHHCPGCAQPREPCLDGGYEVTAEKVWRSLRRIPLLKGITLSGGDPILQAGELVGICRKSMPWVRT